MNENKERTWSEGLADPAERDRTEKIIDIILMRSCEFVCTIDPEKSTVNFRFMSEDLRKIAPHWRMNTDMDFEDNMYRPLAELVREDMRRDMMDSFRLPCIVRMLREHSPFVTTFDLIPDTEHVFRKQLQYYWIDETCSEILCVQTDVSAAYERELSHERLRKEASTDPLTQLSNRRGIRTFLDSLAERYQVKKEKFSVVMCDIDFFKSVNDTYGHDAGDAVLTSLADHISKFIGNRGQCGRMGGEEFLIGLADTDLKQAAALTEQLRKDVESLEIPVGGYRISVTMTFGVSEYDPQQGIHASITQADENLYRGKRDGRNRVVADAV